MRKLQKISVIGVGAIGAAYASKLYDFDPGCVSIITDKARYERYSKNEFIVNDKAYNFKYVLPDEKCEPADLIMIAVKHHNLPQAVEDIRNHVGPDTIILSLLNGISSEEIVGQRYGMDKMLYSMCVGIDAVRSQNKIHFTNFGQINFGEKQNKAYSSKVESVKELFDRAKIPYVIPEDMIYTLWWKFMVNVGINQSSALLKAPYGVFLEVKEAYELMESAMKEVIELSNRMGINLNEDGIAQFKEVMKTLSPVGKTSMLQDIEAGRKTEVEMLGCTVCELGQKYGVAAPVNETLFRAIRTMEKMAQVKSE
jgi:2-dehydropantoate 2-reductase